MPEFLHDPFIQSSLLPLAAGLIAVGLLHPAAARRPAVPAAGIGLAFLAVAALVIGVPALPPPSSMGKLFWSVAAGVALAAAGDAAGLSPRRGAAAVAAWLAAALVWIALPVLDSAAAVVTLLLLLAVGGWIAFALPAGPRAAAPTAPAASLLALALAVGGTALIGASASLAQLALALAAAAGAFLLWNWPVERHGWGLSGRVAQGIAVLLAGVLALFTDTHAAVLLLALPALAAGRLRLPLPDSRPGRAAGAAAVTAAAVLPALIAIAAAYALGGAEPSPY